MTFLQPFILWGLPLILLPVIIHLINRLRHRPQPWAAMMFLVAATRASTNRARLKQWLVLLFRVLAVAALIFFLARPLGGGWLGWAVNAAPDVIVIVLDRSASMETKLPGQTVTRREQALKMIAEAAEKFSETSHLVLLDSATRQPQQIASASALRENSLTGPTDTATDLPALLQTAHKWLTDNRAGTTEIWIASDLQASNWQPEDDRWETLAAQYEDMVQPVRFRLLSFNTEAGLNRSVSLADLNRPAKSPNQLQLDLNLTSSKPSPTKFPLQLLIGEDDQQAEVAVDAASLLWQRQLTLPAGAKLPWGAATLPADSNLRDNEAFFIAAKSGSGSALLVADNPADMIFALLAAMNPEEKKPATGITPSEFAGTDLSETALIIWQTAIPADPARLLDFVRDGGSIVFLPTGEYLDEGTFGGTGFQVATDAGAESFGVKDWNEQDGPLATTEEGLSLPVARVRITRSRIITTTDTVLATMENGNPLLSRGQVGRGTYYHLATLPVTEWSNFDRGEVLVPMFQRILKLGARRLGQETMIACGELSAVDRSQSWIPLGADGTRDIRLHAGIYQAGERIVAVNRPDAEDDHSVITPEVAAQLFGELPLQLSEQTNVEESALQGEVWRLFVIGMLAFLIIESWLILPPAAAELKTTGGFMAANPES
jgi:hypothetical protein